MENIQTMKDNKPAKQPSVTQMVLQQIQDGITPTQKNLQIVLQERFLAFSKVKITLNDIVKSNGFSSIRQYVRVFGEEHTFDFLCLIIIDLTNYLNVGKTMDENQTKATSKLILERHSDLSIEDLKVWQSSFKSGEYGSLFDRIDGQLLLITIEQYKNQRLQAIENEHINSKSSTPVIENFSPELIKVLSNSNAIQEAKKEEQRERVSRHREPTEIDKRVQSLYRLFDRLYRKNKVLINGQSTSIKMIELDGKRMDMTAFIKNRLLHDSARKSKLADKKNNKKNHR